MLLRGIRASRIASVAARHRSRGPQAALYGSLRSSCLGGGLPHTQSKFAHSRYAPFCTVPSSEAAGVQGVRGESEHEFQAETAKLLDIVTNSIYTDKEIFLRELVSNASDALEKFRHVQQTGEKLSDGDRELKINLVADEKEKVLVIEDSGIGMTKQEMMDNLGTIARSGSRSFLQEGDISSDAKANIIGQFGVGFYSAFMVGKSLKVYSRSAVGDNAIYCWTSEGTGKYSLEEISPDAEEVKDLVGTRIKIFLKEDCEEFANHDRIREIIKKYSNYVSFPINVNGEEANTVSAIWTREKSGITDEEYTEFYKFHANAFDEPQYRLHFKTDAPIDIKALTFVPSWHTEKAGMGRMDPGVSLYSRKVLIEANSDKILPSWMRFIKGVVDSEDLPISLSRESMQDSRLLANINKVISKRIIKELQTEAKKDSKKFEKFARDFGNFIKEGICTDFDNQREIAKLLRFNTSAVSKDELVSLDEYLSRCPPNQDKIYYLSAPTRELAEASPYYEVFKSSGTEVIFCYTTLDDFCIGNLRNYNERDFVSAETGKIDNLEKTDEMEEDGNIGLEKADVQAMSDWLEQSLSEVVSSVRTTSRLKDSPAIVVDHESAALRRMMKLVDQSGDASASSFLGKQQLEINPKHPIIQELNELRKTKPMLGNVVARQVYDNALIAAGLVDDPRDMLPRLNMLLEKLLQEQSTGKVDAEPLVNKDQSAAVHSDQPLTETSETKKE